MSFGTVICSTCKREAYQWHWKKSDGTVVTSWQQGVVANWNHAKDSTPVCEGATVDYPPAGWTDPDPPEQQPRIIESRQKEVSSLIERMRKGSI